MVPHVIRARRLPDGRFRAWATIAGRRRSGTYGPAPAGCRLPHAWAADQHGRRLGLAADSVILAGASDLAAGTLAFQAWA